MVTIKDIAKEAKVSQGTVSNVLNKNGKVSSEKIELVENAAKKLGYVLNTQAQKLRMGENNSVAIIIPTLENKAYFDFYTYFSEKLDEFDIEHTLFITNDVPTIEKNHLQTIFSLHPNAIVSISCLDSTSYYSSKVIPTFFVDRKFDSLLEDQHNVGFNFKSVGQDVYSYLSRKNYKNIAVLSGKKNMQDNVSFSAALNNKNEINFSYFYSENQLDLNVAFQVLNNNYKYDAIVSFNEKLADVLVTANSYSVDSVLPEIIVISSKSIFKQNPLFSCYQLDYKSFGQKLAKEVFNVIVDKTQFKSFVPDAFGFETEYLPKNKCQQSLNFLTIDSPSATAISNTLPYFTKKSGIKVNMTVLSFDELYETISSLGENCYYDLIRIDMAWLSSLAEKIYMPLDENSDFYKKQFDKFLPDCFKIYSKVNNVPYAFPLDPSAQILFYNKEIFEDAKNKRIYYEKYKKALNVPTNYAEHNQIAKFFTKSINPQSPIDFGATLAFGTAAVASSDFLPRVYDTNPTIFDGNVPIVVDSPEILSCLNDYIDSAICSNSNNNMWWRNAVESFSNGSTAMTTVFSNHASQILNSKSSKVIGNVGYSLSPSKHPLLGGGVIGISKFSKKTDCAKEFLSWIFRNDTACKITLLGGLSPNACVYENPEILHLYPWLKIAKKSFNISQRAINNTFYSNFNEKIFEKIIGIAVRSAVSKTSSAKNALQFAQEQVDSTFIKKTE